MRTEDLKAGHHYGTCDGELVEPITPVHARYARVTDTNDEGEKTTRIVELDEDSLGKGKRSDPWSNCTPRWSQRATIGVKVRRWKRDDLDGEGDPLPGRHGEVIVIKPDDIKGTWKDYLVLHGAAVKQHWNSREAERIREELAMDLQDHLSNVTDLEVEVSVQDYRNPPRLTINFKSLTEEEARALLAG